MDGEDPLVVDVERHRLGREVGFVEDDDLRALVEPGPVESELAVDGRETLVCVALRSVDHVHEQPGALQMGEERVPEPDPLARALDQPRNVRDRELCAVRCLDGAEHRLERRERVVGDLRRRIRDAAQQRGLAGVRETREGGVGDELQPELECAGRPGQPRLRKARRLTGRRCESRIATPACATSRDHDAGAGPREIRDELAVLTQHLRPERHGQLDGLAVGAVATRSTTRATALGSEDGPAAQR